MPAPARVGVGAGLRLIARDQETTTLNPNFFESSLKNLELELELDNTTASNAYRAFNPSPFTTSTTLNTPEVRNESTANNFDECFSRLLNESYNETEDIEFVIEQENLGLTKTDEIQFVIDQEKENMGLNETEEIQFEIEKENLGLNSEFVENISLYNDNEDHLSNTNPIMEEVWGSESFDQENYGPCLPAAEAEGVVEYPVVDNAYSTEDENKELDFNFDNQDLLKWIIDDQQIEDPTNFDLNVSPGPSNNPTPEFIIEVKEEKPVLRDEEKYRKMREQNNEASRKCRQNRKRKLADVEKEAEELQERNKFLRAQLADMEEEVAKWKKKLLSDISHKAFIPNF